MEKLLIGIAGLITMGMIGYITLSAYSGGLRISLSEKAMLSPIYFFQCVLLVYICHLFFAGIILSRVYTFSIVVALYLIIHLLLGFQNIKRDLMFMKYGVLEKWQSIQKLKFFLFSILMLTSVGLAIKPMLSGMFLSGDLNRHLQFANQLLVGFSSSNFLPYYDAPAIHYPFLTHATLAFLVRIFNIHLFDAYFVLQLFQSILLPASIFFLVLKLTDNFWIALTALVFATLYGGHDSVWRNNVWWFNPAIQRLVPGHITRMLSLSFVPVLFYLFIRISERSGSWFFVITSGVFLGYIGACHAYPFAFMCIFYSILFISHFSDAFLRQRLASILVIAIGIGAMAYAPMIWGNMFCQGFEQLGPFDSAHQIFPREGGEQVFLTWHRFIKHFGIVGVMAPFSALFLVSAKYRNLYSALIISVLAVLTITYAKGLLSAFTNFSLPYHPAQQKFGKVIFLSLLILSCFSLSCFAEKIRKYQNKIRLTIITITTILLVCLSAVGLSTIYDFLKNPWFRGWGRSCANELFREDSNIVNKMSELATKEDVVAVPEKISGEFAYMSGLNVVYLPHRKSHKPSRAFANKLLFASQKLWKQVEGESSLDFQLIFRELLKKYRITFLIVNDKRREQYERFHFLSVCGNGTWKNGKEYLIFRVDRALLGSTPKQHWDLRVEEFLESSKSYRLVLGYFPLKVKRNLRPGLFQSRDLKLAGLTWGDHALWLADSEERRIYKINPETGKILTSVTNPAFSPGGIAWDGEALWSVDGKDRTIYRLDPSNGQILHSVANKAVCTGGLTWGNGHLWNADRKIKKIYEISPIDGKVLSIVNCPFTMKGVTWLDNAMWMTESPGSKICEIFPDVEKCTRIFGNHGYQWGKLTWSDNGTLWAFETFSKALTEFDGF